MQSTKNLILYKNFENGRLFYNMTWLMENYKNEYYNKEDLAALFYECFNGGHYSYCVLDYSKMASSYVR